MMLTLDNAQLATAIVAITLQLIATLLARPLRKITPRKLWLALMSLNLLVLARRALSVLQLGVDWRGETYDTVATVVGFGVSVTMLASILYLKKHLIKQKEDASRLISRTTELAKETVKLAHQTRTEDTVAYRLAHYFIEQRERNGRQ
jgi:hypothetical protein